MIERRRVNPSRERLAATHRLKETQYSTMQDRNKRARSLTRSWYSRIGCFLVDDFITEALSDGAEYCFIDNAVEMPEYVDRKYLLSILNVDTPRWYKATMERDGWIKVTLQKRKKGKE